MRGGFPESFLASDASRSLIWRQAFIRTYLERDIPQFGPRIPATTLQRFWTMLVHVQVACLTRRSSRALGRRRQTVVRYVDLLADLMLVRRLHPFRAISANAWSKRQGVRAR